MGGLTLCWLQGAKASDAFSSNADMVLLGGSVLWDSKVKH